MARVSKKVSAAQREAENAQHRIWKTAIYARLQIAGRARKLMRRLGMWAAGYDCAIVLIGHLNKKERDCQQKKVIDLKDGMMPRKSNMDKSMLKSLHLPA